MSMLEIVPEELVDQGRLDDFLGWLGVYPAEPKYRKEILSDWCVETGTRLERWMVEKVGAD